MAVAHIGAPGAATDGAASRWIIGPRWDSAVCLSTLWFPVVVWAVWELSARAGLSPSESIVIALTVGLNVPHFLTTFTFTYLDPDQRRHYRSRPFLYYAVPLLLIVGGWAYCAAVGPLLLVTVWVLFGEHHVAAQNIGFAALYRARNGEGETDRRIDHLLFNSAWITTVFIFATRPVGGAGLEYFSRATYSIPLEHHAFFLLCLSLVSVGAFLVFLGRQVQRRIQGLPVSVPKFLFMVTTWPSFLAVPFLIQDAALVVVIRSGYHGIQYLALVRLLNQRRCQQRGPWEESGLLGRLVASGPAAYFGVHVALALGVWWLTEVVAMQPGLGNELHLHHLFFPGVALAHFFLDGLTWRFSEPHARQTVVPFLAQRFAPAGHAHGPP